MDSWCHGHTHQQWKVCHLLLRGNSNLEGQQLVFQSIFLFHTLSYSRIPEQAENFEKLAIFKSSVIQNDWVQIGFLSNPDKLVATYMKKKLMFVVCLLCIESLLMEEHWQPHL
jgi:hypothetical protein